jgi:hypothetical protein
MTIQFDEEDVAVQAGTFRMFAFYQDRPITCYAGLEVIADADQAAVESGIELKDKFETAKFLQAFFVKRIEADAFDDDAKTIVTLRQRDLTAP